MSRSSRTASKSGFYHVTMRGNAKGVIFECDEHRRQFLQALEACRDELGFRVIAWCLMDNHVHLVLDMCDADLTEAVHWIATKYACYFNYCEERVGHLFQCPFRSKPIEHEGQLLNTVTYVHMNPERAGLCSQQEYRWSSYREYSDVPRIVDVGPVLGIAGSRESFLNMVFDKDQVVRLSAPKRQWSDAEARSIVQRELGDDGVRVLRQSGKVKRNTAVYVLKTRGLTTAQIARFAALSERTVRRIVLDEQRRIERIQAQSRLL